MQRKTVAAVEDGVAQRIGVRIEELEIVVGPDGFPGQRNGARKPETGAGGSGGIGECQDRRGRGRGIRGYAAAGRDELGKIRGRVERGRARAQPVDAADNVGTGLADLVAGDDVFRGAGVGPAGREGGGVGAFEIHRRVGPLGDRAAGLCRGAFAAEEQQGATSIGQTVDADRISEPGGAAGIEEVVLPVVQDLSFPCGQ